jgi:hypothetical protein
MARRSKDQNVQKAQKARDSPATIRKGIYLSALIYVEGDLAPAADFATPAKAALRDVLSDALKGDHGGLTMTLKKIEVRNDVQDEEETGGSKGSKFEF